MKTRTQPGLLTLKFGVPNKLMRAVVGAAAVLAMGTAGAAPVLWTLSNVSFDDGGVATGSFVYDATTGTYSSITITTSGGTALPGTTYTTNEQVTFPFQTDSLHLTLIDNFGLPDLSGESLIGLTYVSALTNAGGAINLVTGYFNSFEGTCGVADCGSGSGNRTTVVGGQVVGSVIPEPATMALVGLGLLGLARQRRRRPA